jgi:CheY-like chemotaxis protein
VAPVTVFCADDQSSFRDVLRELVAATPGLIHIGEAASGQEAITTLGEQRRERQRPPCHEAGCFLRQGHCLTAR